jgi:hypothetical protein
VNVDLTGLLYPSEADLSAAVDKAGAEGTITLSTKGAESLVDDFALLRETEQLYGLACDLLKAVVLQGAARAALPVTEDVRALVRLARELYSELAVPTPWPVAKPEPEDEE